MQSKTKIQTVYWLKIAVIGLALGFGLQFVRAWTEPTVDPPNGNVGAPINTAANVQEKGDATHNADICVWQNGARKCMSSITTTTTGGTTGICGDGTCGNSPGEACDVCVSDCGACPAQACECEWPGVIMGFVDCGSTATLPCPYGTYGGGETYTCINNSWSLTGVNCVPSY